MAADSSQDERFRAERLLMVDEQLRRRGIRDESVLSAMAAVPRHEFVDSRYAGEAYEDHPVPIPDGQTISQPYIVAAMVESLQVAPGQKVLEVGTGTGYQAAVLAQIADYVFTIERHQRLAEEARRNFQRLGYHNIDVVIGDGSEGLAEHAPYDRIIVAAAAPAIPAPLFEQLGEGGRLIVPIGNVEVQVLQLIRKINGLPLTSTLEPCRFVPLLGTSGFSEVA
jgi:protein-L-isoaspartate(D-aspartate) O-methyltransferase